MQQIAVPVQDETAVLVGEVQKNANEVVRVQCVQYRGYELIDVRIYAVRADEPCTPTRKGICAKPEVWLQLGPLIMRALEGGVADE